MSLTADTAGPRGGAPWVMRNGDLTTASRDVSIPSQATVGEPTYALDVSCRVVSLASYRGRTVCFVTAPVVRSRSSGPCSRNNMGRCCATAAGCMRWSVLPAPGSTLPWNVSFGFDPLRSWSTSGGMAARRMS